MTLRQTLNLILLAALWGGSFLLMRIAVPELGPVWLIQLRITLAALVLLPALIWHRAYKQLHQRIGHIVVLGTLNSALPFVLLAYATLNVPAGFASILNATTPFWAALVGFVWMGQRLTRFQIIGLFIGFAGVGVLISDRVMHADSALWQGQLWAVAAALLATLQYGIAANYTRRYLQGISPVVLAAASLIASAVVLLPFSAWQVHASSSSWAWPALHISSAAIASVVGLGLACTALAYLIYFKLLTTVGPAKTITVTYLIPVFGVLWGYLFLHESLTSTMLLGSLVVLLGVGFATDMLPIKNYKSQKTSN